jgi:pyridoxal phosphate enzyme (YggS family)
MGVAGNLAQVLARIDEACRRVGRKPEEVRLMPVSKTFGPELIREAYAAGARIFGENRVQEAVQKAGELANLPDLSWAIIGHLQSNKVKQAIEVASEFQALDSIKIAEALDRRLQQAGRSLDVLIQVNSSDEPQKHGLPPDKVEDFALQLDPFASLRVRGLMTLAVFSDDQSAVAACFMRMLTLQQRLRDLDQAPGSYDELSMGMSGDFELAIEYGATTVRVGQAIFGPRPPLHG